MVLDDYSEDKGNNDGVTSRSLSSLKSSRSLPFSVRLVIPLLLIPH